jgi:phage recombination protein Bet
MSAELALTKSGDVIITNEQIELIKKTVAKDATPQELQLYFYDCQRRGIHPLDRLLHFTKRGGKYTPIVSIDYMRSQAASTGEYAGSDDAQFVNEGTSDFQATVTVHRIVKGVRCPFTATARWSEYSVESSPMWKKMPYTMLSKCAEALALRKAFPQQIQGLYTREEMEQADNEPPIQNVTPMRQADQCEQTAKESIIDRIDEHHSKQQVIDVPPSSSDVWQCGEAIKKQILDLEAAADELGIYKVMRDKLEISTGSRNPASASPEMAKKYISWMINRIAKEREEDQLI